MVSLKKRHWTAKSTRDYVYRVASDFVEQLDSKMQADGISRDALAAKLKLSKGRISQIFNDPGNFTLSMLVKCGRALNLELAIVAYDDGDRENNHGPIDSDIFRICWEKAGKPRDYFSIEDLNFKRVDFVTQEVAGAEISFTRARNLLTRTVVSTADNPTISSLQNRYVMASTEEING